MKFDFNIDQFIKEVFELNLTDETFKKAWEQDFNVLNTALTTGYDLGFEIAEGIDLKMLKSLQTNVAVFSAFKNHDLKHELVKNLTDDLGNINDWKTFNEIAQGIGVKYKSRFLKTEYHRAVDSANKAKMWQEFKADVDIYPNLEYDAVNDGRTRKQHKDWDGLILPMNHPFWDTHYPPNDHGCRCNVIQVSDKVNTKGINFDDIPDLKPSFNINVGKDGQVFGEDHPYYKSHEYKHVANWAKKALKDYNSK